MFNFLYVACYEAAVRNERARDGILTQTAWRLQKHAGRAVASNLRRLGEGAKAAEAEKTYGVKPTGIREQLRARVEGV